MALTKTGLTWVNGGSPAINATNLNALTDLTDDLVDWTQTPAVETEVSVTAWLTSLASTIIKGRMDAVINGNTVVNLLDDDVAGCEDKTNFSAVGATLADDSSNEIEGTNCMKITMTATGSAIDYSILSLLDTSKYYLLSAHYKNVDVTLLNLQFSSDDASVATSNVSATTWSRLGVVIKPTDFDTATVARIRINLAGSNSKYMFIDALMLTEITSAEYALGASAMLDKYAYHRGVKSSDRVRLLSVGKNKIGEKWILGSYISTSNGKTILSDADSLYDETYYKIDGGVEYTYSQVTGLNTYFYYYDEQQNFISVVNSELSEYSFTTPANCRYIRNTLLNTTLTSVEDVPNRQLELGSSATIYEAFTSIQAIAPVELHSVPDGTACSVNANSGVHTQRNSKKTLLSGDIDSVANGSNLQRAVIGLDAFTGIITQTTGADLTTVVSYLKGEATGYDTAGDAGKWYTDASNLYVLDELGTWADVAAARTALTSTVVTEIVYKLATEVETNYYPNTINSNPSGTIQVDPYIADYDYYDSGITISDSNYPISSLDYVNVIDTATGAETPIALSTCTVAVGGQSFTSTAISDTDFVDYGYFHQYLSTIPTVDYVTSSNIKASVDGNSENIKDLDSKMNRIERELSNYLDTSTNSGTFTETGTLGSPYEKNIALGSDGFKLAIVMFRDNASGAYGRGAIVTTGITQGSAISFYGNHTSGSISSYAYERGSDANLSIANNVAVGGADLVDCYINGSNLHFKWSGAPTVVVHWRVIK